MFGADKRLVLANDLYSTMYGLDPKQISPGTTLPQILAARVATGCLRKTRKNISGIVSRKHSFLIQVT